MKNTLLPAVIACSLLGLALTGCGTACGDLADRICGCEVAGTAQDDCKSAVKNQVSSGAQKPGSSEQALCQQLLGVCVPPAGQNLCQWIQTPVGKESCGLSYNADGGTGP